MTDYFVECAYPHIILNRIFNQYPAEKPDENGGDPRFNRCHWEMCACGRKPLSSHLYKHSPQWRDRYSVRHHMGEGMDHMGMRATGLYTNTHAGEHTPNSMKIGIGDIQMTQCWCQGQEEKLQDLLDKVIKENKKKDLTVNCKRTMYGCQKRKRLKCKR